jgi:hypothetical protein
MKALALLFGAAAICASAATHTAVFESGATQRRWDLKMLDPSLPSDWSPYEFLVLEMRSSTPQRFELRLFDTGGVRRVRIHPMPAAWIRAAVPLRYFRAPDRQGFDLASLGNKARGTFWVNLVGTQGPLKGVEAIGVAMENPLGRPVLEIRAVRLSKDDPGDAILEPKPVVDEFGQWIYAKWPGKANTPPDLTSAWSQEDRALDHGDFGYCKFGGYLATKANATGFFRVEQIDGRWWFVDPDGHLFLSIGSDVMQPSMSTRTAGRENAFAALPPQEVNDRGGASFYSWNLLRRFGADWRTRWVDFSLRRMAAWGLNTIGNWSDPQLWSAQRAAYVVPLHGWGMETGVMGMPDVFSPEFQENADNAAAAQCAPRKNDPWLLGYFVANEPPWPGREELMVSAILEGPDTATRREAVKFLAAGDEPGRRREFILRAFERFVQVTSAAIRKNDPNHLNLGMRFGSRAPEGMIRACRIFDVYSMNSYTYSLNPQDIETAYRLAGRPILIGEFHFGTLDRGLAAGLRQTANQEERGVAYRYYVETAAAMPQLIGLHWFEWVDEPPTGRGDGENYNIGFVDVTDRPYRELVMAAKAAHRRLAAIHTGKEPPVNRTARIE